MMLQLLDIFVHKQNVYLVFELMQTDLERVIRAQEITLTPADIKAYMHMLILGTEHCHANFIMHRVRRVLLAHIQRCP
jgi:cyclin-dependent kinase 7